MGTRPALWEGVSLPLTDQSVRRTKFSFKIEKNPPSLSVHWYPQNAAIVACLCCPYHHIHMLFLSVYHHRPNCEDLQSVAKSKHLLATHDLGPPATGTANDSEERRGFVQS